MMEFLVCTGDEALLSLDTLKELTIVPCDFPKPIDKNMREPKIRRVKDNEDEWEEEEKVEKRGLFTLQERVGSLRTHLEMKEMTEDDWEDEKRCNDLKKQWLRDFPDVFKEDLGKEDRIDIEPIKIDLVDNHEDIQVFHPTIAVEVRPYMEAAARKELA